MVIDNRQGEGNKLIREMWDQNYFSEDNDIFPTWFEVSDYIVLTVRAQFLSYLPIRIFRFLVPKFWLMEKRTNCMDNKSN